MLAVVATLCAGCFSGAALYITLVEQPARLAIPTAMAIAEFRPGFPRAASMQAALAIVGALAALGAWRREGGIGWLVAAACLGTVVLFTFVLIRPVYEALLDATLDTGSSAARELLTRWGRLHAVRTALGLAGFVSCLAARA